MRSSLTKAPSLHRHYPASAVLRAFPSPQGVRPVPHGPPVDHPSPRQGASRVARAFLVCMLSPLPRHSDWGVLRSFPRRISLPRKGGRVGLCIDLFEVCSAFTQVTACTLAGSPYVTRCIGGFSQFVTSLTAPIASGRSDLAGWGLHPLESAALSRRTPTTVVAHCTR